MSRDDVLGTLRKHESELRAAGVVRLSLFGSMARGEARSDSDIDLLAAFDPAQRISLLDMAGLELELTAWLGRQVELVEEGTLHPRVEATVAVERVRAF